MPVRVGAGDGAAAEQIARLADCSRSDVWCATICATVQYRSRVLERHRRCGSAPAARIAGVDSNTSQSMSSAPCAWSAASSRCGSGGGSPSGRAGCAMRNGASASAVTIHGETDVRKLLPRNGPSGCNSHDWMSRADQSFSRQKPAICSRRFADRNRLVLPIAGADPHAEFQLVVEIAARPERRRRLGPAACAGRSAAAHPRPTAAPTTRGCDRRPARTCSSASADCRAVRSGRPCARDGCRRRSRCSRRSPPAGASCTRRRHAAGATPCRAHRCRLQEYRTVAGAMPCARSPAAPAAD